MRVLLVDDETELASALAERLELRGIEAQWVGDGEAAIKLVKAEPFDLAVLDMKMPKIDGLALKAHLEAIRPTMKFIFLTGYGSQKDYEAISCQVGEICYLVKPVDIQVLIQRMHDLLNEPQGEG
jgi:DNA-binding response OmpR family regulator